MRMKTLPPLKPGENTNYVAFFLTFACNLSCSYCVNSHHISPSKKGEMDVDEWIRAANRLVLTDDLHITLQGGEPTLHTGFYRFVQEVKSDIRMDLLTNMMFAVEYFIEKCPPVRFRRGVPYAPIRATFHPFQNDLDDLIRKTMRLLEAGFSVGLFGITHPDENMKREVLKAQEKCQKLGIDFRLKEFLGEHEGKLYGTFKFGDAIRGQEMRSCQCRTSELLVDPSGFIFRCHSDLYSGRASIGHILDEDFSLGSLDLFRDCNYYGLCHPFDVKIKNNRFQIYGHTSVEIISIENDNKVPPALL